ncbi:MAG: OmpA family protein [Thiobacillaceae bacterium]
MRLSTCIVIAGLLASGCASQIVYLPPAPDGTSTSVDVAWKKGTATLSKQGYAFYSDRVLDVEYRVNNSGLGPDFGPVLDTMEETLAAGLPDLPHSYATLLQSSSGSIGTLSIQLGDAKPVVLNRAGQGLFIDGYPDLPHSVDKRRLQDDFGPAFAALAKTLRAMRSYIILLDNPNGEPSKVVFHTRGEDIFLEHAGASLTLDGIDYTPDAQVAAMDFMPVESSTKQILDEGLPKLPHSYVSLMESPTGPLGELEILEGKAKGTILDKDGQAVLIDGYSSKIYALDQDQYRKDFGDTVEAMPPLPVTLILYFTTGRTRLTQDSRAIIPLIVDEIRKHPAADVSIAGNTDTVGSNGLNDHLSLRRSKAIEKLILRSGAPTQEITLAAYGKSMLAVQTPDNTPELLNRRVEVTIR